ncbi:hypothetical protein KJ682_02815 [bacterium]|nr:hypothetical protein [bacterium]
MTQKGSNEPFCGLIDQNEAQAISDRMASNAAKKQVLRFIAHGPPGLHISIT